jgi:hypothetical protein
MSNLSELQDKLKKAYVIQELVNRLVVRTEEKFLAALKLNTTEMLEPCERLLYESLKIEPNPELELAIRKHLEGI